MASPQKTSKPASRWGFLSQAVNSLESRLDVILADEDDAAKKTVAPAPDSKDAVAIPRASTETTRSTTPQPNDRLQQRLAQAMAKKKAGRADGVPPASEPVLRTSTPVEAQPRQSLQQTESSDDALEVEAKGVSSVGDVVDLKEAPSIRVSHDQAQGLEVTPSMGTALHRPSSDSVGSIQGKAALSSSDDADAALLEAQLEHEDEKSQMQEEIQGYIERIDALSSKLQYLAKEASQSAKDSIPQSEPGSLERKIHEKDEKIALLMEEGQRLSVTEMKNLNIIKKLRSQMSISTKDQEAARRRADKAEKQVTVLDEKARVAEQATKRVESQLSTLSKASQDLDAVTRERNALNETLAEMKAQVAKANARAETALLKASTEKLEAEKKRSAELQDDLTSAKLERDLSEEKLKREVKDLQASLQREKENNRTMETEMLAEQANLESKLESFRVRAEDASSNDVGDSQAKLLRQIETLQSQYAAASQNWQGIETTLLARITALETERDEVTAREADVRRRLREVSLKAKTGEREVEDVQLRLNALQEGQSDARAEIQRLTRRNEQIEDELAQTQKEIEDQKERSERDYARKLDEEKTKWAASVRQIRNESPSTSVRKGSDYVMDRLMSPVMDRPQSRRSSALAAAVMSPIESNGSLPRQLSVSSFKGPMNGTIAESPSIGVTDVDEYFANVPATPGSGENPHSRRGIHDLVSTSTVGAGPSVQLVERMSANVRRLETEKAAAKDELVRLTTQRDESRTEVVRLMREVEQKRKTDERLKQLEEEHQQLSQRHQTTLELLGEKSEQVDELKQDIVDVKQMYRELADHMK